MSWAINNAAATILGNMLDDQKNALARLNTKAGDPKGAIEELTYITNNASGITTVKSGKDKAAQSQQEVGRSA